MCTAHGVSTTGPGSEYARHKRRAAAGTQAGNVLLGRGGRGGGGEWANERPMHEENRDNRDVFLSPRISGTERRLLFVLASCEDSNPSVGTETKYE